MKTVREKRELNVQKDAWAKWRQSFRSHLSELQYNERLILRYLLRWKSRLSKFDSLETAADRFYRRTTCSPVLHTWKCWKRALALRDAEKAVTAKIGRRVKYGVVQVWKKHTCVHSPKFSTRVGEQTRLHSYDRQIAIGFYNVYVMKVAIRSWKAARDRIRVGL